MVVHHATNTEVHYCAVGYMYLTVISVHCVPAFAHSGMQELLIWTKLPYAFQ